MAKCKHEYFGLAQEGSSTGNVVEIVGSGVIEVNDPANDDDEEEGIYYNTDNTLYRKTLGSGDSILINS